MRWKPPQYAAYAMGNSMSIKYPYHLADWIEELTFVASDGHYASQVSTYPSRSQRDDRKVD